MNKKLIDISGDVITDGAIFNALDTLDVPWKTDVDGTTLDLEYYFNISGQKDISPLTRKVLGNNTTLTSANYLTLATMAFKLYGANWSKEYATLDFEYNPISNYDMTESETTSNTTGYTKTNTGTQSDSGSTSNTGTQTNAGTVADTGTVGNSTSQTVTSTGSGSTGNEIYGFNSVTGVDDSASSTTNSNSTTNAESVTRTDNTLETTSNTRTDNLASTASNTRTDNLTETNSGSGSGSRSLTRSGNIGITSSQQLIESERQLYIWNFFYNIVFKDIDKLLTLCTYTRGW